MEMLLQDWGGHLNSHKVVNWKGYQIVAKREHTLTDQMLLKVRVGYDLIFDENVFLLDIAVQQDIGLYNTFD